jgi:hypothetical protein
LQKNEHIVALLLNLQGNRVHPIRKKQFEIASQRKSLNLNSDTSINSLERQYWLTGFFEGDGHVSVSGTNYQIRFSLGQKERSVLEFASIIVGVGQIYPSNSPKTKNRPKYIGWQWSSSARKDLNTLFGHFELVPPLSPVTKARLHGIWRIIRFKDIGYHLKDSPYGYRIKNRVRLLEKKI